MSNTIENPYENFIALSRYARWIPEENRRETWGETVDRYFDFMLNHLKENYNFIPDEKLVAELKDGVFKRNVMPSMRSVMTSGAALERDNVAGYNCSFVPVDSPRSFDETMYILMCGTGVGFSVEYKYVNKLPSVPESFEKSTTVIIVEDSKQGWAKAYRELLALLWSGQIPAVDVSKVRPAGARLKTMGGRSSGPQPLVNLFDFTIVDSYNLLHFYD
jgi:ribonucleoside-diphosphate reductase alpha chain